MSTRPGQLRIIGGRYRSRRIAAPRDASTTRPLPDRVKESVFNLLRGHVEGERVVDVFAGTGSFGLEALSRGAARAVFVERDREIVKLLRSNVEALGVGEDEALVLQADALAGATAARVMGALEGDAHVVFCDPPYPLVEDGAARGRVFEGFGRFVGGLDGEGYGVLRTPWPLVERDAEGGARAIGLEIGGAVGPETHVYGSTAVHLYMNEG